MTILGDILGFAAIAFIGVLIWIIVYGLSGGFEDDDWWKMTYEEEMDWLMNEQGLSYDEAKEIAEIPHRTLDK